MGLWVLGAGVQELRVAEPDLHGAGRERRPVRVPRRGLACNPYLTQAALLTAGLDGVKRELDPGPPQQRNTYDLLAEGTEFERVPDHLGAALDALEADEVVRSAMPGRLYDVFMHYKRDEWERYLAAVTDWDREQYLEVLPDGAGSPGSSTATETAGRTSAAT